MLVALADFPGRLVSPSMGTEGNPTEPSLIYLYRERRHCHSVLMC